MANRGRALMGAGVGTGKRRALEAAEMAISSPLLEDVSVEGATGILINITGGPSMGLHEVHEASSLIEQAAHEDANIIFGSVIDPNMGDEIRVTVIATGFDRSHKTQMVVPEMASSGSGGTPRRSTGNQITAPYGVDARDVRDPRAHSAYTPSAPMPRNARGTIPPAYVVEEPEISVYFAQPDSAEVSAVQRALEELSAATAVPAYEAQTLAAGSSRNTDMGPPLIQPTRARSPSRPNMRAILADDHHGDNELDVPTFIRRHNTLQG